MQRATRSAFACHWLTIKQPILSTCRLITVEACGNNDFGRLGVGDEQPRRRLDQVKIPAEASDSVSSVHAGGANTGVLLHSGTLLTCGINNEGQLGHGRNSASYSSSLRPVDCTESILFSRVSIGRFHSLACSLDGAVYAWGRNTPAGECAHNTRAFTYLHTPTHITSLQDKLRFHATDVCAGIGVSICIGMVDGHKPAVVTFGHDSALHSSFIGPTNRSSSVLQALLGPAEPTDTKASPRLLGVEKDGHQRSTIIAAAAGETHGLLLSEEGFIFPFGTGPGAQAPENDARARAIACGGRFSVALMHSGGLRLWGENAHGCLGAPDGSQVDIGNAMQAVCIDAGWKHCAAVSGDHSLFTWGWSGDEGTFASPELANGGQLGVGDRGDMVTPAFARSNVSMVACGLNHTVALCDNP